jgi:hypothetical protein
VSLFLVNFGFWIGSLWGDRLVLVRTLFDRDSGLSTAYWSVVVPEMAFIIGWAVALVAVAAWEVTPGRRWIVNLAAVFGAIHFSIRSGSSAWVRPRSRSSSAASWCSPLPPQPGSSIRNSTQAQRRQPRRSGIRQGVPSDGTHRNRYAQP